MLYVLFAGIFLYAELILQILTGTINSSFVRILLFLLMGSGLITLVILPMRKKTAFIVSQCLVVFFSVIYVSQFIFNRIFHDFYSIEQMLGGGEAIIGFNDVLFAAIGRNVLGILLLLLPIAVPALLYKLNRFPTTELLRAKIVAVPAIVLVVIFVVISVPAARDPFSARGARFGFSQDGRTSWVREVGLVTTMGADLLSNFIATEVSAALAPVGSLPVVEIVPEVEETQPEPDYVLMYYPACDYESDEYYEYEPYEPTPHWVGMVNGFDIDFDALIERDANNRALVQLHEYFASLTPSSQNRLTGVFYGFNLITVSAEAFSHLAICPDLTPTLYHMQHQGVFFENFYSVSGNGTIGGEMALITGLMPAGAGRWAGEASRVYLPFTFASQFNALGVPSFAYHSGSYTFYNRNTTFPGLGYQFRARNRGLTFPDETGWHTSDIDLVSQGLDEFIYLPRFHVHFMTLSGHSEYIFSHPIARRNRHLVEHLPYSTRVKAYLATQIELDLAMEYLLNRLDEAGIAERTIIVLATDHFPYGLTVDEISELAGFNVDPAIELHRSAAFIYARGMQPEVVTAPAFVPDLVPTVSNMLGFSFDSRFFSGRDVFSDAVPLAFLDGGFVSNAGVYNRNRRTLTPNYGIDVPYGYVDAMLGVIDARRSAVRQIVRLNYFASIREYWE